MLVNKALSLVIDAAGARQADVARAIGKSPQFVNDALRRENMRVATAVSIAETVGCELVLRKRGERDGVIITAED